MKKLNSQGFILAETLVVSVFMMILFTMIYLNFFPLIGEYEKREHYDDVDGKYVAYWIKRLIESEDYNENTEDISMMNKWGYMRFECRNVDDDNNQREICINLVKSLEISGCDSLGNNCDIFITRYSIGSQTGDPLPFADFKNTIRNVKIRRWHEVCVQNSNLGDASFPSLGDAIATVDSCASKAFQRCCQSYGLETCTIPQFGSGVDYETMYSDSEKTEDKTKIAQTCAKNLNQKVFRSADKDYILTLPNYTKPHKTTGAAYRIIVVVHHQKDNNDFYSYSTMEVNK